MLEAMIQFVAAVDAGSFSGAGQRLNKNASSVARQIDRLEEELGTRLFIRSTRRLELTLDGQRFYEQSLDIIRSVDNAKLSFRELSSTMEGELTISAFDSYGTMKVIPLLPKFQDLYPNVRVSISLSNAPVDLYNSPFDLAIRHGRPEDSNLISKPLVKDKGVLVASPAYLKKHTAPTTPDELKEHACLTFFRQRQHTYWFFQKRSEPKNEQKKLRIHGQLSSCGGGPLLNWIKAGMGISLMPHWYTEEALNNGELVELLPEWRSSLTESGGSMVYMLWQRSASQNPLVRAMVDFLAEQLVEEKVVQPI